MSDLVSQIKSIQRAVGAEVDGVFGPVTAGLVLAALQSRHMCFDAAKEGPATRSESFVFDARSEGILATLDAQAVPVFRRFLALAKAAAAPLGCDYVMISGHRTWDEQNALYAQGRTKPGPKVTNARGGYSWHNYGVAADFGVFKGKIYLDGGSPAQRTLAERVHAACAVHAESCGLEWGGTWMGKSCDPPHYQIEMGRSTPNAEDRAKYKQKGSVL